MSSAGLRPKAILSWELVVEFDLDLSILAFFLTLLLLSLFVSVVDVVIGGDGDDIVCEEVSERGLLEGSFDDF